MDTITVAVIIADKSDLVLGYKNSLKIFRLPCNPLDHGHKLCCLIDSDNRLLPMGLMRLDRLRVFAYSRLETNLKISNQIITYVNIRCMNPSKSVSASPPFDRLEAKTGTYHHDSVKH